MGDDAKDPVDHARTTRPHAGESMKDTANFPAFIVLALSLLAFVACIAAFATGHATVGLVLACLAAVGFAIGLGWLYIEHRRVRRIEDRWHADNPDASQHRGGDRSS